MTEGKKIGLACAIGGAIGTVVALIVAVSFWWLGLLAGFSGGYMSYEFRAVVRAIPQAWRMTVAAMDAGFRTTVHKVREAVAWFFTPQSFFHTSLVIGTVLAGLFVWYN